MSPGEGKVEEAGWTGRVDQLTDWLSRLLRRTERLFVPWILEAAVTSTSLGEPTNESAHTPEKRQKILQAVNLLDIRPPQMHHKD